MYSRRSILLAGGTGVTLSLAGCLGVITGEEPLEFTAAPAVPSGETLESTGYKQEQLDSVEINETVGVGGVEREINASYWSGTYQKELDALDFADEDAAEDEEDIDPESVEGEDIDTESVEDEDIDSESVEGEDIDSVDDLPGAQFIVVSMPAMEVAGSERNPFADMDSEELLEELLDEETDDGDDRDLENLEHRESPTYRILNDDRTVDVFGATADTEDGEEISLSLYIATVSHEDDIVMMVGIHPEEADGETDEIQRLFESVEHPLEPAEVDAD